MVAQAPRTKGNIHGTSPLSLVRTPRLCEPAVGLPVNGCRRQLRRCLTRWTVDRRDRRLRGSRVNSLPGCDSSPLRLRGQFGIHRFFARLAMPPLLAFVFNTLYARWGNGAVLLSLPPLLATPTCQDSPAVKPDGNRSQSVGKHPIVVSGKVIAGVDVCENAQRVAESLKHLVELGEIVPNLLPRRMPLQSPHGEVVLGRSRTRVLGRHMQNDVWPLT